MKKASIIIASKNEEKGIKHILDYWLEQDYKNKEIIIIDDSTDNTPRIIKKYKVKHYKGKNKGVSNARNQGLMKAGGEIIIFSDADGNKNLRKEKKDLLARLCEPFNKDDKTDVVFIKYKPLMINNLLCDIITLKDVGARQEAREHLPEAYTKKVLLKIKGFNEELEYGEDTDMVRRVLKKARKTSIARGERLMMSSITTTKEFTDRYLWYGRTMIKNVKSTKNIMPLLKVMAYVLGIIIPPLGAVLIIYNYLLKSMKTIKEYPIKSILMPWINYLTFLIMFIGIIRGGK